MKETARKSLPTPQHDEERELNPTIAEQKESEEVSSTHRKVGLSIRIFDDEGLFPLGTRFELLFGQQVIDSAGTEADGTLLFPVQLGESPGLVLRKALDQARPKPLPEGPRGPGVPRWSAPYLDARR